MHAASGSFDPVVEWRWTKGNSYITPMVAQLTDDNADGTIDAKDTPDIVVIAQTDTDIYGGSIVVLDGKTGNEHFRIAKASTDAAPALGDIDGDGLIDIVAIVTDPNNGGGLFPMAFDNEGNAKWSVPPAAFSTCVWPAAVAIADLDHDGSPEIITACDVYSSSGQHLWSAPEIATQNLYDSPTAADLDGDDFLEVIFGAVAYKHDGSMFYSNTEVMTATHPYDAQDNGSQFVAIADFDADGQPEIVVSTRDVLFILDHAGKTLHKVDLYMTGEQHGGWAFPPAVADLDADGTPEILISNGISFTAYDAQLKERWSMPVQDGSGIAAGTAFDFLGDGSSEAMYGDETMTWAFAGSDGKVLFSTPRASGTIIEYPTVVDVDNDGSAEVLIVTSYPSDPVATPPGLTVIGDRMGRWVPARRILNQDTYHVTNINDDGTIPKHELPSWKLNNSFRAQAQVNPDGVTCIPRPE
jgi:hypothetical protein